jgi:cytochrome c peroxidase
VAPNVNDYVWDLPAHFPMPNVPDDNPMSNVKVELGRHLFYDRALSSGRNQSCSSCHQQALGFTDGRVTSVGSTFETLPRNTQGLANVAYAATLTWAHPNVTALEQQAPIPIFGTAPVELAMYGMEAELLRRLRDEPRYQAMFPESFPDDSDPFSIDNMVRAISAFQRTLIAGDSAYDRFVYGNDTQAMSDGAQRGMLLFNSDRLSCTHCHGGVLLQDAVTYVGTDAPEPALFHNTGLYNLDGAGAYPALNTGLHAFTQRPEDMGRFRTPGLRNVAFTAPYMHDASIGTLGEVIDHYAAGGRTITTGPNAGNGSTSPLKDPLITGFALSPIERVDLIAFLQSLSDESFIIDARFSDPWSAPCELCAP